MTRIGPIIIFKLATGTVVSDLQPKIHSNNLISSFDHYGLLSFCDLEVERTQNNQRQYLSKTSSRFDHQLSSSKNFVLVAFFYPLRPKRI